MQENAVFTIEKEFDVPTNRNIRADQIIQLTGVQALSDCPGPLRRVVVWDADNEREMVLLTNLFDFGSTTIAAIYKERWKIELFFQALKQNLTVKSFVGTSENAPHPDLDSPDRAAPVEMAASPLEGQLVFVQFGIDVAAESIHLPRVDQVASQSCGFRRRK
jgi:hypothetical protein